jgi:lipoate-protein ligase A
MPSRTIRLVRASWPEAMAMDTAVSRALLTGVAEGTDPETLRLSIPGRSVAFGKHDAATPWFGEAVSAARDAGFEPFLRLAGGRAAVFHHQAIALAWTMPDPNPLESIYTRFAAVSELIVGAMGSVGIDAAVGELPGEYCPGAYSIHVGSTKVAGFGQRLARGAAHIGGVVVVADSSAVRHALVPVYQALRLEWDPATAGALTDTGPDVSTEVVIDAIVERLGSEASVVEGAVPSHTIRSARELEPEFRVG